jgi:dihydrofolate reductase
VLNAQQCFIIGGGSIYNEFLSCDCVNKIILTRANNDIDGTVFFPFLNENEWEATKVERQFYDERDECDYEIWEYKRK